MLSTFVQNEQTKLLATAINNIGVALIVAGIIAPSVGYVFGTLRLDGPLQLLAIVSTYGIAGCFLLAGARRVLKGLA